MARNFKVPKLLKLMCSSKGLYQGFRRAYLPQLPQEAVDSVRLWPLRHSESSWDVFLSVARPTATVSSSSAGERDYGKSVTRSALCQQPFLAWGNFLSGAPETRALWCCGLWLTRQCCSLEHRSLIQVLYPFETV